MIDTTINITESPDRWVRENRDTLRRIIKHADDQFTRALAINVLVTYGDEPAVEQVKQELEYAEEVLG